MHTSPRISMFNHDWTYIIDSIECFLQISTFITSEFVIYLFLIYKFREWPELRNLITYLPETPYNRRLSHYNIAKLVGYIAKYHELDSCDFYIRDGWCILIRGDQHNWIFHWNSKLYSANKFIYNHFCHFGLIGICCEDSFICRNCERLVLLLYFTIVKEIVIINRQELSNNWNKIYDSDQVQETYCNPHQ